VIAVQQPIKGEATKTQQRVSTLGSIYWMANLLFRLSVRSKNGDTEAPPKFREETSKISIRKCCAAI
jgi:hypothetical protein